MRKNFIVFYAALIVFALGFFSCGAASADETLFENTLDEYRHGEYVRCSYALHDIDANGTDELLVRYSYSESPEEDTKIYTYANGTVNEIGEFWPRRLLLLDKDGNIYSIGSSGAGIHSLEVMNISDDGTALITTEAWKMDYPNYTHISKDGITEVISESDYETASERFYSMTTDFVDSLDWRNLILANAADEELVKGMAPGTWTTNPRYITFGKFNGHALRWRVLEVYRGGKTAFLALDGVLRNPASEGGGAMTMAFDDHNNSFPGSQINTWLNDTFLPVLSASLNTDDVDCILDTTYGPDNNIWGDDWAGGDGPEEATSKIFLLGANEVSDPEYFFDGDNFTTSGRYYLPNADRDVGEDYRLRTPGPLNNLAAFVKSGGLVHYHGFTVDFPLAVRPALKIDLSSPVFASAPVSYPSEDEMPVKSIGTWTANPRYISFGSYNGHDLKWRVLEEWGDKTAFLVLDGVLRKHASEGGGAVTMAFSDGTNIFPDSPISKWLNDEDDAADDGINGFIHSAGLGAYKAGILDTTYGPDSEYDDKWEHGGPGKAVSKIFLLSVNEAATPQYFDANAYRDVDEEFWLRSPSYGGEEKLTAAALPRDYEDVDRELAVRPALRIDLSSPVFASAPVSSYENTEKARLSDLARWGSVPQYVRDKGHLSYNDSYSLIRVTGNNVRLRSRPNTEARIIADVNFGEFFNYCGEWTNPQGERWVLVGYRDLESRFKREEYVWVHGDYAELKR